MCERVQVEMFTSYFNFIFTKKLDGETNAFGMFLVISSFSYLLFPTKNPVMDSKREQSLFRFEVGCNGINLHLMTPYCGSTNSRRYWLFRFDLSHCRKH